jgi:hypothetical protein
LDIGLDADALLSTMTKAAAGASDEPAAVKVAVNQAVKFGLV